MSPGFQDISAFAPVPWAQIPDLGLYMDQVITFIGRIYQPLYGADMKRFLSPAMINNYVKSRLIPRPAGKKYSREQIALLIMIVALKQVSAMEEIRAMLARREGQTVEALYAAFCQRFNDVIHSLRIDDADPLDAALDFAILSSGFRVGCVAALNGEVEES
ncbi:MAG: DUF1836 domain-containing protein [Clostridia bacterium]|nr:DUF1836 domain-containing protein [Clostridia bacterium]